jgi:hypothetical protein
MEENEAPSYFNHFRADNAATIAAEDGSVK